MTSLHDLHTLTYAVPLKTVPDSRRLAICPLAAGSAATSSKLFCQTREAFVNLTVNTRRYCVLYDVYLDMKIFLD